MIDVCRLIGYPAPSEADPDGRFFAFGKGVAKIGGGKEFAAVWYQRHFTWEYKWPGAKPADDPRVQAIAAAAKALDETRAAWLNPPDAGAAELKKRTLTNLYNQRTIWLQNLHAALDQAVWATYGWDDPDPAATPDDAVLARLLALNLARAGMLQGAVVGAAAE